MKIGLTALLIFVGINTCFCQPIRKEQILGGVVNRYWTYGTNTQDHTTYWRCPDREYVKRRGYGGFIFRKDGSFEEILAPGCAVGRREPYSGNWSISNDTIKVVVSNKLLLFKIVSIEEDAFTAKDTPPITLSESND